MFLSSVSPPVLKLSKSSLSALASAEELIYRRVISKEA